MIISEPQRAGRYGFHGIGCWAVVSAIVGAAVAVHLVVDSRVLSLLVAVSVALGTVAAIVFGVGGGPARPRRGAGARAAGGGRPAPRPARPG
ncbi:hypothetical protein, partial [Nocardia carnea]|uniref:hypothetical protein n=1 Tax=Nocardia carnea TaxID=37328 RepID=UPI0024547B46